MYCSIMTHDAGCALHWLPVTLTDQGSLHMHCDLILPNHTWPRYNGTGTATIVLSWPAKSLFVPNIVLYSARLRKACLLALSHVCRHHVIIIIARLDADTNSPWSGPRLPLRVHNWALRHDKASAAVSVHAQHVWQPQCQLLILTCSSRLPRA